MKTNYDQMMLDEINQLTERKTLLLHACCGPCSSNILKELSDYFDITIYYANSNIYPADEYCRRRDELKTFLTRFNQDFDRQVAFVEAPYEPDTYIAHLFPLKDLGERSLRCKLCYHLRMRAAFDYAKSRGFDYWTTTLSVSPHKVSQWINDIGEQYQCDHPRYLYADFKKRNGYLKSTQMTAEYGMYRQNYCGCLYSYQEMMIRESQKTDE